MSSMMILNDQGGNVMSITEDVTSTLRAQDHGHPPVICFEPGIARREGNQSRFVMDKCSTLRADMGDNKPAVCFQQNQREEVRNMGEVAGALTAESGMHNTNYILCFKERAGCQGGGKGLMVSEEKSFTLSSYTCRLCYAIEGNVVDRVSAKNGKGWCEDVSPTLNTQDRHAVVYALEGNGARPSHLGKGYSDDGTMYTLNTIEQHSVCYGISRSALKGGNGSTGGMPVEEDVQPTITANGCGAVVYPVEHHPMDSRVTMCDDGIVQTLSARMGTGGNNVPLVLIPEVSG